MGLATARALARAGERVLILERFRVGHERGGSHGSARIFRLSYPQAEFVALAREALAGWRELEAERGEGLLTPTGSVDIGPDLAAHRSHGLPYEELDPETARRRFGLELVPGEQALFQWSGGVLAAERAQRAFLASALEHGAELLEETEVLRIEDDRVTTAAGEIAARGVVVTAGAWSPRLVAPLDLVVTRETVAYFHAPAAPGPVVIDWSPPPRGELVYALPTPEGTLKAGLHRAGPVADPDGTGGVDEEAVQHLSAWVARRYRAADATPLAAETCLYANRPDERFVLERRGGVVVGSACSGHGFKFAPAIGERLAGLALGAG